MLDEDTLKLSYYREIGTLDNSHNVTIVQHTETLKTYLKKTLTIYCKEVYYQIKEHPLNGIPHIYDIFEIGNNLIVIEEYITGNTLHEMLDNGCVISEKERISFLTQLCDILTELHTLVPPIIHRDIKPSNIMLTDDRRIMLIDLNGAKYEDSSQKQDTQLIGTQGYAAPEQYGFGSSRTQTDIYSLGVLISVLTNDVPGGQERYKHIIKKCTEIDISNRYTNVLQVKKALIKAEGRRSNRTALIICLTVAILAVIAVIAVYLKGKEDTVSDDSPAKNNNTASTLLTNDATESIVSLSPVGAYVGNDDEILVIDKSGLAYYYCYSVEYTELECPWEVNDGVFSIYFSKMHCTATADISKGCNELILKSESRSWNSEVFDKISDSVEGYIKQPPSASENITVSADGTMFFQVNGMYFTVPKQFIDLSRAMPGIYAFADVVSDENYCAGLLFAYMDFIDNTTLPDRYSSHAEKFAGSFMTNVQTGYPHIVTINNIVSYCINVSGLLNEDFDKLENDIYSGQIYIIPSDNDKGAIYVMMIQTIAKHQDDQSVFNDIINSSSNVMPDAD